MSLNRSTQQHAKTSKKLQYHSVFLQFIYNSVERNTINAATKLLDSSVKIHNFCLIQKVKLLCMQLCQIILTLAFCSEEISKYGKFNLPNFSDMHPNTAKNLQHMFQCNAMAVADFSNRPTD